MSITLSARPGAALLQRLLLALAIALALLIHALPAVAQDGADQELTPEQDLKAFDHTLDGIDRALARDNVEEMDFKAWIKDVSAGKSRITAYISDIQEQQADRQKALDSLGPPVTGESADVVRRRRQLAQEKTQLESRLATCRLLLLRSDDILDKIAEIQKQQLAERLLARGPTFPALALDNWQEPTVWISSGKTFLSEHSGLELLTARERAGLALLIAAALGLGAGLRRLVRGWARAGHWGVSFSGRFLKALVMSLLHYAPQLLASTVAAAAVYTLLGKVSPVPFLGVLAYGLPVYFLLTAGLHLWLAPCPPAEPYLQLPAEPARKLVRRLKVLLMLVFVGYLLFATLLVQSFPETAILLARGVFTLAFILNLMWALFLLGRLPLFANTLWLRLVVHLMLLGVLAAEWLGFRNLSLTVLRGAIGTVVSLALFLLVARLLAEIFDGIDMGRAAWHRRVRQSLALKPGAPVPGLVALRVTTTVLLWLGFLFVLLLIWGMSETAIQQVQTYLTQGFTLGTLKIIPLRILLAALTLVLLLAASGWLRTRLERKWLTKTRMDRGAREAVVAVSGYVGIAIAVLVALGMAGVEYANLAIIAGALSVGIGFGLQNIVNNFVSGLIILFERPIRTGDWIVVGNTEGYVKRIRIRSTQIQTFDRADVIVPNSELISNQVTNWMLYDLRGRVRVPVGVAYGSDTQKVKQILLDAAVAHPQVITDNSVAAPLVLFRAFGDSSLDFELRAHIKNIDNRLSVISDLNFAIDAEFRRQGIEIPFPQRDLHLRSWPPGAAPPSPPPEPPASS